MAGFDDDIGDVDSTPRITLGDAVKRRNRNPSAVGKRLQRTVDRPNVFPQSHDESVSQKRGSCQPKTARFTVIPIFGYDSSGGDPVPKSISSTIGDAFLAFVKEHGQSETSRITGVPKTTVSRWANGGFSLNTHSINAVCKIEEVRAAAAAALLRRPDEDSTTWEAISARFSSLLSPAAGWTLVRMLKKMDQMGMLDSKFSALEGLINQRANAEAEGQAKHKRSKPRVKREIPK